MSLAAALVITIVVLCSAGAGYALAIFATRSYLAAHGRRAQCLYCDKAIDVGLWPSFTDRAALTFCSVRCSYGFNQPETLLPRMTQCGDCNGAGCPDCSFGEVPRRAPT